MEDENKKLFEKLEGERRALWEELTITYIQVRMSLKLILEYVDLLAQELDVEDVLCTTTEAVYKKIMGPSEGLTQIRDRLKVKDEDIERLKAAYGKVE